MYKYSDDMEKIEKEELTMRDDIDKINSLSNYEIYGKKRGWSGFAKGFLKYKDVPILEMFFNLFLVSASALLLSMVIGTIGATIKGSSVIPIIPYIFLSVLLVFSYPFYVALSELPPTSYTHYILISENHIFKLESNVGVRVSGVLTTRVSVDKEISRDKIQNIEPQEDKINIQVSEGADDIKVGRENLDIYDKLYNLECDT